MQSIHPSCRASSLAPQVYDPEGTGFVNVEVLKSIFEKLGFESLGSDDVAVLVSRSIRS